MKKVLTVVLCMLLVVSFAFSAVACASSVDGVYRLSSVKLTDLFSEKVPDEIPQEIYNSFGTSTFGGSIELNEDGTFRLYTTIYTSDGRSPEEWDQYVTGIEIDISGTYTVDGDKLTLVSDSKTYEATVADKAVTLTMDEISEKALTFTLDEN